MPVIRPATCDDARAIAAALNRLRDARILLRAAGALRAARAAARAMKSAEGAQRHVRHRIARS